MPTPVPLLCLSKFRTRLRIKVENAKTCSFAPEGNQTPFAKIYVSRRSFWSGIWIFPRVKSKSQNNIFRFRKKILISYIILQKTVNFFFRIPGCFLHNFTKRSIFFHWCLICKMWSDKIMIKKAMAHYPMALRPSCDLADIYNGGTTWPNI